VTCPHCNLDGPSCVGKRGSLCAVADILRERPWLTALVVWTTRPFYRSNRPWEA